jgi:hypothetical protein
MDGGNDMIQKLWQRGLVCWLCLALALAPLSGCGTTKPTPKPLHLAAVVIDGDRLARPEELGAVRVWRAGAPLAVTVGMALQEGDRIDTGRAAHAVIRWPSGSELYMRPGSSGEIGSIRKAVGEFFVKVKGVFGIETEVVRTAADGTAFAVRTGPGGAATVTVFEGRVRVDSLRGLWPTVTVGAGSTATAAARAPQSLQASPAELQKVRDWVEPIEKLLPPAAPTRAGLSTGAVVAGVGIAVLLAVLASKSADKPQPPAANPAPGNPQSGRAEPVPAAPQPPRVPTGLAPGSTNANAPPKWRCPDILTLSWQAVPGANDYSVTLEHLPDRQRQWRAAGNWTVATPQTPEIRGQAGTYRWSVRARAGGVSGPAAGPVYFQFCENVVR